MNIACRSEALPVEVGDVLDTEETVETSNLQQVLPPTSRGGASTSRHLATEDDFVGDPELENVLTVLATFSGLMGLENGLEQVGSYGLHVMLCAA
jgi:hypothetical protein